MKTSANLSHPCTIEHKGQRYVGYSNSEGEDRPIVMGRKLRNNNSAELAAIPLEKLNDTP